MTELFTAALNSPVDAGIATVKPAVPATAGIAADDATELLASVGFLLVPGAPFDRGPSYLMIALRQQPTLAHFDPERIAYWTVEHDRPAPASLEWPIVQPDARYAWGTIRMVDRVRARNEFASFGGRLTIARDGDVHAALFRSEAPILAIGGHSGPADPIGVQLAGFFALLRAAAGEPETNALINEAGPNSLYAAFLVRTLAVVRGRSAVGASAPRLESLLRSEISRIERDHPTDLRAGLEIDALL